MSTYNWYIPRRASSHFRQNMFVNLLSGLLSSWQLDIFVQTWCFWIFSPDLQINVIFEQRFGSPLDKSEIPIWFSQSNGTNPLVQIGLPVPAPTAHHSPATTAASRGKPHKWWKCFACHLFTYFREEERIAMTFDLWTLNHTLNYCKIYCKVS